MFSAGLEELSVKQPRNDRDDYRTFSRALPSN